MKILYAARHATEAHLLRGYLEAQGIAAVVRGEFLAGGIGDLPMDVCSVCVVNDDDFREADALLRQFLKGEVVHGHAWRCASCGETLEGQFNACWNCGHERDVHASTAPGSR